jgi:hypothetical protein
MSQTDASCESCSRSPENYSSHPACEPWLTWTKVYAFQERAAARKRDISWRPAFSRSSFNISISARGYSSAILARIAHKVVALEADPALAEQAKKALAAIGIDNVAVVTRPLAEGYAEEGPYDAILLNGAVPDVPKGLLDQLKEGGRLMAVITDDAFGRASQWRRLRATFDARTIFEAGAPRLPGFERKAKFVF